MDKYPRYQVAKGNFIDKIFYRDESLEGMYSICCTPTYSKDVC